MGDWDLDMGLGIRIGDWDLGLTIGDWELGLEIEIGDCD